MKQPLFSDLITFILLNKGKTFNEYSTEKEIAWAVHFALENKTLYYSLDEWGNINGMIMAEKREPQHVLFIIENLAMSLKNLKQFARRASQDFKGYRLEWLKHGINKKHNTERIWKHLCTQS